MSGDPEVGELIEILNNLDPEQRQRIHEAVYEQDQNISEEDGTRFSDLRDLTGLDENHLQTILRESDLQVLANSLEDAPDDLKELFFQNLSSRRTSMLKDEIKYNQNVDEQEAQEAREKLLQAARRLAEASEFDVIDVVEGD